MLDREGGDSPSPEDDIEGGLSIDEVGTLRIKKMPFVKPFVLFSILVTSICHHDLN